MKSIEEEYADVYSILAKLQPLVAGLAKLERNLDFEHCEDTITTWASFIKLQELDKDLKELLRG